MLRNSWKAIYEDCTLRQDWIANQGDSFGEVERRGLPKRFFIGNKFGVNLETGELYIYRKWFPVTDQYGQPLKPLKLLYARRVTQELDMGTGQITEIIHHRCGYYYAGGMVAIRFPQGKGPATIVVKEDANDNHQRSGAEG